MIVIVKYFQKCVDCGLVQHDGFKKCVKCKGELEMLHPKDKVHEVDNS